MKSADILTRYIEFFKKRGHTQIPNASLVPENDPTTLFTSSGMQPLVPYLLGEEHPSGSRLVNSQNCFRAQDIEEIGNNRHTTFFRMLGNWSLGDYFKKEQLPWLFEFLIDKEEGLGLDPHRLFVTVFAGNNDVPRDKESIEIWQSLFHTVGMTANVVDNAEKNGLEDGRIFTYGVGKNWWSRSGTPEKMPVGEPGGPDSEVFFDFGEGLELHEKSAYKNTPCHPNCDCGRFMEIGNSVFMQYQKQSDDSFKELPQKNVDFGGGLERFAAAVHDNLDIFATDLYTKIIQEIEEISGKKYSNNEYTSSMRVIADHLKASVFLILAGVVPSNKEQGYVLRRLLRRSLVKLHQLGTKLDPVYFSTIAKAVITTEMPLNKNIHEKDAIEKVTPLIEDEVTRFGKSLEKGLSIIESKESIDTKTAFDLYQSYGFPVEITIELLAKKGQTFDLQGFKEEFEKHKNLSRTASAGMFKGGLADHSEKTVMGHTATHLLHQALRDMFGKQLHQTGSNITSERLRFDFNFDRKITEEELRKLEHIVNEKIKENMSVHYEIIPTKEAHTIGAIGLFMDTYGENSKIYFIGGSSKEPHKAYSIEFCGGPHVDFTGTLKTFTITKEEALGAGQRRIYAVVGQS